MPVKSVGVAQASSELVMTCTDPVVLALVPLTSQVATEDGDEDFVGSDGSDTINTEGQYQVMILVLMILVLMILWVRTDRTL